MIRHSAFAVQRLLAAIATAVISGTPAMAQAPWHMVLGPEDAVDIGKIHNAPNGHISYQQGKGGLALWVDGRVGDSTSTAKGKAATTQGTFILHPASWSIPDLVSATPVNVFKGVHDPNLACSADSGWYRDYAAINAIIPGPHPGQLLAFVDGEFHPLHTSLPLRASIGVATSTDGMRWTNRAVIIQGNDMVSAKFNCDALDAQMTDTVDDIGSAGPTAVVRKDGNTQYIYLYYLDRVRPYPKGSGGKPTADIYLARAPYSGAGAPNTWQFWTGGGWSAPGPEAIAKPVILAPKGGSEAAHPQVTYNTLLKRWLIIFHTRADLYAATSEDGIAWDTPQALGASTPHQRAPAFPTLVTEGMTDQQSTGATGWLFYSREVPVAKAYLGYRRSFTISTVAGRGPPCSTPRDCCSAKGGTWSGGRCS